VITKKDIALCVFVPLFVTSLVFGLVQGGIEKNCLTQSIAATINIPFRLACEFMKPRFK